MMTDWRHDLSNKILVKGCEPSSVLSLSWWIAVYACCDIEVGTDSGTGVLCCSEWSK